ncbi:class I SAM-dependent methyltransferase [Ligilactobacillus acidipiscis]|uniref:class I SAM-dependent methyltransferase n=1 Tax=Ligilactobacillus acidipiscis TaxID=89059 RepID=UPI0022E0167E|nr:class I SAM-dependent methyltransferase [Ligilactobacillus acidipiscis]
MHYKIHGIDIPTELSALPINRANQIVLAELKKIIANYTQPTILDYGCGKLRHSYFLLNQGLSVCGVDSIEQITRIQKINKQKTSLTNWSKKLDNLTIYSVEDFSKKEQFFDIAICTNVLSAIPFDHDIIFLLDNIYKHLTNSGRLFLSVQYKNSYFDSYKTKGNANFYNGGWIINNKSKNSYYRLIQPALLRNMCIKSHFVIENEIKKQGSIYLTLIKNNCSL